MLQYQGLITKELPRRFVEMTWEIVGSSALVIEGRTNVPTLEAITCREGLAIAEDLMIHNFLIELDSKQVINDV